MIAKNERGYKVVLRSGVLQLARNLDNQRLLDKLHKHEQNNDKNAYIPNKNVVADCSIAMAEGDGFDETLEVAFNDVDLCLKVYEL